MHLEYFGIRVSNLERSLKFYTELFGLKEVRRGDSSKYGGGRGIWVLLKDEKSGQQLELNWYPPGSQFAPQYVAGEGLDHIGFQVEDVPAKFKELVARGVEVAIRPEETGDWNAYVKDPDGNWIELYKG